MTITNEENDSKIPFNSTPYSNSELVDLKLSSRSFTKGRRGVSDGQNAITNITLGVAYQFRADNIFAIAKKYVKEW